jgi:hypothetical protein
MPRGISLKTRFVDPGTVAAVPGTSAGDMVFLVEARDAAGAALATLPSEINLSVRYGELDVIGLDEQFLTLSRLNPANNQWTPAPKLARDAASNFLAASTSELGVYAVHVP